MTEETLIYPPMVIQLKGKLVNGEDIFIEYTPEQFKDWIHKMIDQGLNNCAIFKEKPLKHENP